MENSSDDLFRLVLQAQMGHEESTAQLAERVRPRLFTYLYRLTLNEDLTEDLVQETLLAMVESLQKLRKTEAFWPWLFRTALGKVQHHFRDKQRQASVGLSRRDQENLAQATSADHGDGLGPMIRQELSETIFGAMRKLSVKHRNVVALRCFEDMSYAEIAELTDCSELHTRVLFFRAKHLLRQQLSRQGFGKKMLLTALGLFGAITASTKAASAASTVTASSVEVGFAGTVIGAAGTKAGLAVIGALAAATWLAPATVLIILAAFGGLVLLGAVLTCFSLLRNR